jgi:transposase, IS5 family
VTTLSSKKLIYTKFSTPSIVAAAKRCGIGQRQTFTKEGKVLRQKAGGYANAKQFKRLARTIKRQRTIVGKLIRKVRGKLGAQAG